MSTAASSSIVNPNEMNVAANEVRDIRCRGGSSAAEGAGTELDVFVLQIARWHNRRVRASGKMIEYAKRAGDWLRKAKKRCCHGYFESWFEARFDFSLPTARVYMRISKEWKHLEPIVANDPTLSVEGLRYILRRPKELDGRPSESNKVELARADLSRSFTSRMRDLSDDQVLALYERREEILDLMFKTVGPTVLAGEEAE